LSEASSSLERAEYNSLRGASKSDRALTFLVFD
jgi:hypothetical protein